jgi:hypothetical protein
VRHRLETFSWRGARQANAAPLGKPIWGVNRRHPAGLAVEPTPWPPLPILLKLDHFCGGDRAVAGKLTPDVVGHEAAAAIIEATEARQAPTAIGAASDPIKSLP